LVTCPTMLDPGGSRWSRVAIAVPARPELMPLVRTTGRGALEEDDDEHHGHHNHAQPAKMPDGGSQHNRCPCSGHQHRPASGRDRGPTPSQTPGAKPCLAPDQWFRSHLFSIPHSPERAEARARAGQLSAGPFHRQGNRLGAAGSGPRPDGTRIAVSSAGSVSAAASSPARRSPASASAPARVSRAGRLRRRRAARSAPWCRAGARPGSRHLLAERR
jgi:hypothetical protein